METRKQLFLREKENEMKAFKKLNQSVLSIMLVLAMTASMLIAAPAKEAKAATAAPTVATDVDPDGIRDVTVANVTGATVSYQTDDNGVSTKFIRILLPSGTAVNALQNLQFSIKASAGKTMTWDASKIDFTKKGSTYTCSGADLYNKSYTLSIGGTDYILAAGITGGKTSVPAGETGVISGARLAGVAAAMDRDVIESDFMGNPYVDEMGYDWTSVTYIITGATLPNDLNRTAVILSYKPYKEADQVTVDLTSGQKEVTINGATYQVTASFGDVIVVSKDNYYIDLHELAKYLSSEEETVASKEDLLHMFQQIQIAQNEYFANGARTFSAGTTVMDVMQDFLNFAYGEHKDNTVKYFTMGDSSRGADVSYIDYINGLSYRQVNRYAGWMYSDDPNGVWKDGAFNKGCSMPNVMSNAYTMTKDTKITWFYTTNYMAIYQ